MLKGNNTPLIDETATDSYRMYTSEETWNSIEISEKTDDGFHLAASCCNAQLHLGEFDGYFKYESPGVAIFKGENYSDAEYKITAEIKGDSLLIFVDSDEETSEDMLLGFGMNVRLSGGYLKQ